MTLLEAEHLIRKISDLLQEGGGEVGPKLASDYASICHAANLRLQQCEAMIKAGDSHQAIQLAETAPNLLDLVTILEFRDTDAWRNYCQQNALAVAERIDARSVGALNDSYGRGITTDHPLYGSYRKAVLQRNNGEALKILQSIARLNPSDANAVAELARLDAKVLAARLEHLGAIVAGGDSALILAEVDGIEAFGFKSRIEGEVWSKAQAIRCDSLVEEAGRLRAASDWKGVFAKIDFVHDQQKELNLELAGPTQKQLEALTAWAESEREKDRKNHEFNALLSELRFRIQQSEEKDTSARYIKLPELRDDFESLNKIWRSLTDLTRPIPEASVSAFQKRSALLEAEIARRTAVQRRNILLGAGAALIAGTLIVWFVLGEFKTRDFAAQLQATVSNQQARAAEHLLERLHGNDQSFLRAAKVNAAAAEAESFVTKERALLKDFNNAFAKLPEKLTGDPNAARINGIAQQLVQTRAALNALAPDLKSENEPRVHAFETEWQRFLSEGGLEVNRLLEEWIASAEKQGSLLDYREPIETAKEQLSGLASVIQKINECESGLTNHVSIRGDLLERATATRAKLNVYSKELAKIEDGMVALKRARNFAEYGSAISLIASSEFSGAPALVAASAVNSLSITEESALRALLGATNGATWAFIKKGRPPTLFPSVAVPAERMAFERLTEDPSVSGDHQHYRLWLDREGVSSVEWITAGLIQKTPGWRKIAAFTPLTAATTVVFENREYGYFGTEWKLSPTQPVFRLEQLAQTGEASAYGRVGLGRVWNGGNNFGAPLLEVLDNIKNSHDGSAIFRAYLFLQLVELMRYQPDAWGLSFCPTARADAARLGGLAGVEITSGDWFVASKAIVWNAKLGQFFDEIRSHAYAKEAAANVSLEQAVAKDGLRYVGFVGLDGRAVIAENPPPAEIWSYDTHKRIALIQSSGMFLAPVFALPAARVDYLARAGINVDSNSVENGLPPMFRAMRPP